MNNETKVHLRMNKERRVHLRMNKKGDAATIMLFVVALILVVAALFYFAGFNKDVKTAFKGISYLSNEAVFSEKYLRAESALIAKASALDKRVADRATRSYFIATDVFGQIAASKNSGYTGARNLFFRIASGDFSFNKINCSGVIEHVLEIKRIDYNVRRLEDLGNGEFNEASVSRTFDICNVYDSAGDLMNAKCESVAKVMTDCGIKTV